MVKNVSIIGGDKRLGYLIGMLCDSGFNVKYYGVEPMGTTLKGNNALKAESLQKCMENADVIVSAIPFSRDGVSITSAFTVGKEILIEDFIGAAMHAAEKNKELSLLAGAIPEGVKKCLEIGGIRVYDINKRNDFALMNAIPTAEGVIQYIIANTPYTIASSGILIIGAGRVAKVLACKLSALDADVTVSLRKNEDAAFFKVLGIDSCKYDNEFNDKVKKAEIIINTVPDVSLFYSQKSNFSSDQLLIDVASGTHIDGFVRLPGLPGKVAPKSAAAYIKNVMVNIMAEAEGGVVINGK